MKHIEVPQDQVPQLDGDVSRIIEGTHDIALFRVGDELRAIDNACPHQGASLSDGWIEDGVVACPWHAWQFDTASGECLSGALCDVKTYPIELQGERVCIRVRPLSTSEDDDDDESTQMDANA